MIMMMMMEKTTPEIKYFILHILAHISCSTSLPLLTEPRLSIVDWTNYNSFEPQGPGTYAFGYDIEDPETDNIQYRDEERYPNGTVVGSYGYVKPDGNVHIVKYIADEKGYRATVENLNGQPKIFGQPFNSVPTEGRPSSSFPTASESHAYRKPTVHEQRLRPVDSNFGNGQQLRRRTNYNFPLVNNINDNNEIDDIWRNPDRDNFYVEPQKFTIRLK